MYVVLHTGNEKLVLHELKLINNYEKSLNIGSRYSLWNPLNRYIGTEILEENSLKENVIKTFYMYIKLLHLFIDNTSFGFLFRGRNS